MSSGCGPGGNAPKLDPLANQTAYVGSEFTLHLAASDLENDTLDFSFANTDLADIESRASLSPYGPSSAVFRWTPMAQDIGVHLFDFSVSDGSFTDTETISITVKGSVGENGAPTFRQPLGTGTTLDLANQTCLDLNILVDDPDSAQVTIAQEEPIIEGATLDQSGNFTGVWHWCPTPQQISAQDRYQLILSADDGENPKTIKNFLIVLLKAPKPDCPGAAPVITHTPEDVQTLVGLTIDAQVSDVEGLKGEPLLYYSETDPGTTPSLGQMTQATMMLISGDMQSGTFAADVPNPVASQPAGTEVTLYYVIIAQDNDDATGDCDHVTQAPASGSYRMTVTNPGGSGGLGLCEECTADVQCGDAADHCLRMGSEGLSYCFQACTGDTDCPQPDYYCSITEFTSVDGAKSRQCIPTDYSCVDTPPPGCVDDDQEENDTRAAADAKPALAAGTLSGLKSCPAGTTADDEDFYRIVISADTSVTASISGGAATDLDLALLDETGATLARSDGTTSTESITQCLTPGTYYLRVYTPDVGENSYSLTFQATAVSCAPACADDPDEPDDTYNSSRRIETFPYVSDTNAICPYNQDWFRVYLFADETVYVTLAFTQTNPLEDLDVALYQGASTNLTPCSTIGSNGCSTDSNENFHHQVSTDGYYYVVVSGWNGSQNLYDICIGLSTTDCPPLSPP